MTHEVYESFLDIVHFKQILFQKKKKKSNSNQIVGLSFHM
jgi:hypothetical protein